MSDSFPPTTVIVVNYNGGESLMRCLDALSRQSMPHDIVVVDNASADDSARLAHERFPGASILPLRRNVGFARAVNIAVGRLRRTDGLIALLNPDTVPEAAFLERLTTPLAADESIGAAAGTLVFASQPDVIASAGIVVHRNGVALDARLGEKVNARREIPPVFGASGGAAAYRLSAFLEVGGFSEPFFLFLEDVDLAWRLRLRGWQAISAPDAIATHEYSASAIEGSPLKRRLLARNRVWTVARCWPTELWRRDRKLILGFDLMALVGAIARGDAASARGRAEAIASLPARLAERRQIQRAATTSWREIDAALESPVGPATVLRLRRLTARLATRERDDRY